jgi:hypothetical protein
MKEKMRKLLANLARLLEAPKFAKGDLIKLQYGTMIFEVMEIYYTQDLNLLAFVRDDQGQLYSVDPKEYVKYGGSKNI